ncbi:MAG: response regulator [Chthoniobacteraceae bacterium]
MKVLIADDDPIAVRLLRRALESFGHEVVSACNGAEALEIFNRDPVRIVVSDWMMPELDGLSLCEKIRDRAKTAYTYFILLTSQQTTPENYDIATCAGVDDFLLKPLHRPTLKMRLRVADRMLRNMTEIRQLKEMIPMCSYCHKVRDDDDYWERVDTYIRAETGTRFSHGICPDCLAREMANLDVMFQPPAEAPAVPAPDGTQLLLPQPINPTMKKEQT